MKKTRKPYACPETRLFVVSPVLLSASTSLQATYGDDTTIIGYGGVDTEGSQTPGSRLWGAEEEDEYDY